MTGLSICLALTAALLGLCMGLLLRGRPSAPPPVAPLGVGLVPDLHDGLVLVNDAGRIVDVNAAVSAMFGHPRDDLLGRDLLVLIPDYGKDQVGVARWRRTSRGAMLGTIWNLQGLHSDGGNFPVELSFQKIAKEGATRFLYAIRDAAQDRVSDETQRHKDVLLDEVRHEALQARRAKARFLSNMSHELRTPLNAIIGYSEILKEDAPSLLGPDCDRILRSAHRLRHLVESVLELSRLDSGREYVFVEPFSLADLIRRTAEELGPLAEQNGNRIEVDVHPKVGRMRSDLAKVHQILHHLIENACRFTERGRVTVRAGFAADDEGVVVIEVSDTGVGIPLVHRDSVFEAFEVVDRDTRRLVGGAGLGLAIARGHAVLLGGSLVLDEQRREGCGFQLRLPLDAGTIEDDESEIQDEGVLLLHDTTPTHRMPPRAHARLATPTPVVPLEVTGPARPTAAPPTAVAPPSALVAPPIAAPPARDLPMKAVALAEPALPADVPLSSEPTPPPAQPRMRRRTLVPEIDADPIAKGPRILVLDRAGPPRAALELSLREAGYRATVASDGRQAVYLASVLSPAAMVVNPAAPGVAAFLERGSDDLRVGGVPMLFATLQDKGWFLPTSATLASSASMARFRALLTAFVVAKGRALVLAEATPERDALCSMLASSSMSVHAHDQISREIYAIEWDLVLADPSLPNATTVSRLSSATGQAPVVVLLPSPLDGGGSRRFQEWMRAQPGTHVTANALVGRVREIAADA